MHPLPFLDQIAIILAAAVLILAISRPIRLPGVIGFLITGMLIGPNGFGWIPNRDEIEIFAEIGVVMLLFFIGLEFSLAQLKVIRRQFMLGGVLQVIGTITIVVGILTATDALSLNERIFLGCVIALSSTAIVLKMLSDRGELEAPHGKMVVGILLFQDFCIVPMIVFTPMLAGQEGTSFSGILLGFLYSLIIVGGVVFTARKLLPRFLEGFAKTKMREAFLMGSLLVCLVMALITYSVGFSYALGAFIAGLLISESEYNHEVIAEIMPFRDFFASMFFISVGMLFDLTTAQDQPLAIVGIGISIVVLKFLIVVLLVKGMGISSRTAIMSGMALAQIGEFSFVLIGVGLAAGILSEALFQTFLAASILSMMLSPLLIIAAPKLAERVQAMLPFISHGRAHVPDGPPRLKDHVIIVGFGLNGQNVARVLAETGIPYVVLETDGQVVKRLIQEDRPAIFGDVTRKEILQLCGIARARIIVLAIADPNAQRTAVHLIRSLNASIHIIVRTRMVRDIDELAKLGANEVIPEEFETSIEIFTRVLDQYHIPRNVINAQIEVIRNENYGMLRGLPQTARGLEKMTQILAAGTSDTFLVTDDLDIAGRTVGAVDLKRHTGTILIAIVRGETPTLTPPENFMITPGDILILVGTHANMDSAFDYLGTRRQEGVQS
jgi:CPA2 family monovalent cation:H+ antiporter-2